MLPIPKCGGPSSPFANACGWLSTDRSASSSPPVKFTGEFRSDTGQEMLGSFRGLSEPNRVQRSAATGCWASTARRRASTKGS